MMDRITRELKAKDIPLGGPKVHVRGTEEPTAMGTEEPTEQNFRKSSPPSRYYYDYDDIYMADSETHEEERTIKRGLRKAIRGKGKGKGKAQQVEDEDEKMDSENKSSEGKLSDSEQDEDEDEKMVENEEQEDNLEAAAVRKIVKNDVGDVEENEEDDDDLEAAALLSISKSPSGSAGPKIRAQPSQIPPVPRPYAFSKPKGGAGPKLRPSQIPQGNYDSSESESDNPPQPLNTLPNPLNLSHDALTALTNTVLGVIGQRDDLFYSRMRRRKIISEKIKQPTIRASETRRKKLGVRQYVNQKTPTADE